MCSAVNGLHVLNVLGFTHCYKGERRVRLPGRVYPQLAITADGCYLDFVDFGYRQHGAVRLYWYRPVSVMTAYISQYRMIVIWNFTFCAFHSLSRFRSVRLLFFHHDNFSTVRDSWLDAPCLAVHVHRLVFISAMLTLTLERLLT